jgi:hypothetical protein
MEEVIFEPSTEVTRLKFKTGGYLVFDENFGSYKCSNRMFKGRTSSGSPRGIPGGVVDSVYFLTAASAVEQQQTAKDFHRFETIKHRRGIKEPVTGVYRDGQVFKFDGQHGEVDYQNRTITGTTKAGDTLSFAVDELNGYHTRKSNAPAIIGVTLGLAAAAAIGLAIYVRATAPW